jgi:hypothetical protein
LQAESTERSAEAVSLLLDVAERLLNSYAAALPATDPSDAVALEHLMRDYAAARSDLLQHALDQAVAFYAQGTCTSRGFFRSLQLH